MKKLLFPTAVMAVLFVAGSCTTPKTLYSWYDYEDATYQYSKKSTEELQVKVLEQYKKITERQKGVSGVVPPGMYAEYGYLLYKTGKKDAGLSFLKKEVELYPESDTYISRIIKQLEK